MSDNPGKAPQKDLYDSYDKPPAPVTPEHQAAQNMHQEVYSDPNRKTIHLDRDQIPADGLTINIINDNQNINDRPTNQCVPNPDTGPNYSQYCQPYQNFQPNYYQYPFRQNQGYDYNAASSGPGGLQNQAAAWNGGGAPYYAGGAQCYGGQPQWSGGGPYQAGGNPNYNGGASDYQWAGLGVGAGLNVLQDVLAYKSQQQYYNTMQNINNSRNWDRDRDWDHHRNPDYGNWQHRVSAPIHTIQPYNGGANYGNRSYSSSGHNMCHAWQKR